jgi:hypothetical protein
MVNATNKSKKRPPNDDTDEHSTFCRELAEFREKNRTSAWNYLVKQGAIDSERVLELRGMIRRKPVEFRKAMVELARDCGVLRGLDQYAPFDLKVECRNSTSRLNMCVMIAEAIASDHGGWAARKRIPRKPPGVATTRARKVDAGTAASV